MNAASLANTTVTVANGFQFAYYDSDPTAQQGIPIVLLHGFCGHSAYWQSVIPLLAFHHRVIVPDLRGHGHSGEGLAQSSIAMTDFADDLHDLLEHLQIDRVHLFGHSLGGYITLAFAERYEARLASFGLVHSTAFPDREEAKAKRLGAIQTITEQGLTSFSATLAPRLVSAETRANSPSTLASLLEIAESTNAAAAIATIYGMRERPDRRDVIRDTPLPVLLLAGAGDDIVPVADTLAVTAPHVTHEVLTRSGHMGMFEQPDELTQCIVKFLLLGDES